MRIISGKYRGKKLKAPILTEQIKPTSDRAKEAFFNMLFDRVRDSFFIDMFAGSGQMGIEALSRGAKKVCFVDISSESLSCIKENLKGVGGDFEILNMNFDKALKALKETGLKADISYCDPPYELDLGKKILASLHKNDIMKRGGIVAIERNKSHLPAESKIFYRFETRHYGKISIDLYRREKRVAITGTFDPFTNGHLNLVTHALKNFDRVYIVILKNKDKIERYSLEKRKKIIHAATEGLGDNLIVESYDGLAIDYCNENDIQYILRGIRNSKDFEYEKQMADFNLENGRVTTILMPAKSADISSTRVREGLDSQKDVSHMISKNVIGILKE